MQKQPICLHIPPLYEESQAVLTWQELEGADAYELDCHFDETFDDAMEGRSWQDLQGEEMSWSDIQELEGSWQDLHTLPARGRSWRAIQFHDATWADIEASEKDWKTIHELEPVFTVYRGEGNEVPGPEQGFCWSDIHDEAPSWQDLEDAGLTWIEMMKKRSRGLSWQDLHEEELSWSDVHTAEHTWLDFARKPSRGMSWDDINARHFSWQDIQDRETTWMDMRRHTDDKDHRGWEVDIPLYSKKAIFRLRAIADGERSGYLTTALYDLLPRSLKNYAPPCLHIPTLYEEGIAEIVWGDLYGASGFVLERRFDGGTFEEIYRGPGENIHLECAELDAIRDVSTHFIFRDVLPIKKKKAVYRVKAFNTTDESQYLESAEHTLLPRSLKKYMPPCIHVPQLYEGQTAEIVWGDLYGAQAFVLERRLNGAEFEQRYDGKGTPKELACPALEAEAHAETHLLCSDTVPIGAKTAGYQVKAYNTTDASQYRQSAEVQVIPVFYREESKIISSTGTLLVQIGTRQVADYRNILLTLEYDASKMKLVSRTALAEYGIDAPEHGSRGSRIQVESQQDGRITFRCTKGADRWSGINGLFRFTVSQAGGQIRLY